MREEQKQAITLTLTMLKGMMDEYDIHFGIVVDKNNPDGSQIAFLDKKSLAAGEMDGIQISIDEMNRR